MYSNDELAQESKVSDIKHKIDLKELEITKDGIRIKYNRFNKGRQEECYYPQRGEVSNNYSDRIDELLGELAVTLLDACGLDDATWNNPDLKITNLKLAKDKDKNQHGVAIIAKLVTKNELLNKFQRFTTPRISQVTITEYGAFSHIKKLISELEAFYNGKTKVEQFDLGF